MTGRVRIRILAVALALALAGCMSVQRVGAPVMGEGRAPSLSRSGFRHDPMRFLEADRSVQGAMVRTFVFGNPLPTDGDLLRARIDEVARAVGEIAEKPDSNPADVLGRTRELIELGCPVDHPRVKELVSLARATLQGADLAKTMEGAQFYALQTLCYTGVTDAPGVAAALRWQASNPGAWLGKGCPWGTKLTIQTLWAGRDVVDATEAVGKGLRWMVDRTNEAGCLEYFDPWGFLDAAGTVDHPLTEGVVLKQLPMILRAQRADGGWGKRSFVTFRALVKHGLLDRLRTVPPLPPDWLIVRFVPAPGEDLRGLAWDGRRFWVYSPTTNEAIAVSPMDGSVRHRVRLPHGEVSGIGCWGEVLAVAQKRPKRLLTVSPDSGDVLTERALDQVHDVGAVAEADGRICVADLWVPGVWVFDADPRAPGRYRQLAGPLPGALSGAAQGVWHVDLWASAVIKSGPRGELLDWGEAPFGPSTAGVAWDGRRLWALDGAKKRICALAKSPRADLSYRWLERTVRVRLEPILADGTTFVEADTRLHVTNSASIPVQVTGAFELNRWLWPQPHDFAVEVPADSTRMISIRVGAVGPAAVGRLQPLVARWSAAYRHIRRRRPATRGVLSVDVLSAYGCPRSSGHVRVDGDLGEWDELPLACTEPRLLLMTPHSWTGPQDCSFRFGVAFDDRFLYVALEVFDDTVVSDGVSPPWLQDGVEVRLDARPGPARAFRGGIEFADVLLVALSPGVTPDDFRLHAAERMPDGLQARCRRTPDGYVSEIAVPVAYLDAMQGGDWRDFRLNIAVDDHDGAVRDRAQAAQLWWQPDWRRPEDVPGSGTFRQKGLPKGSR